eukprot:scaffold77691_cov30-Tisochrysis_lutea.AAC.4
MTEPFCGGCNRIRLTADGSLKVCSSYASRRAMHDLSVAAPPARAQHGVAFTGTHRYAFLAAPRYRSETRCALGPPTTRSSTSPARRSRRSTPSTPVRAIHALRPTCHSASAS